MNPIIHIWISLQHLWNQTEWHNGFVMVILITIRHLLIMFLNLAHHQIVGSGNNHPQSKVVLGVTHVLGIHMVLMLLAVQHNSSTFNIMKVIGVVIGNFQEKEYI